MPVVHAFLFLNSCPPILQQVSKKAALVETLKGHESVLLNVSSFKGDLFQNEIQFFCQSSQFGVPFQSWSSDLILLFAHHPIPKRSPFALRGVFSPEISPRRLPHIYMSCWTQNWAPPFPSVVIASSASFYSLSAAEPKSMANLLGSHRKWEGFSSCMSYAWQHWSYQEMLLNYPETI